MILLVHTVLLSVEGISVARELITLIEDNGVMMVISAVVIYFLVRVLNSMLAQNSQVVNQIIPQIQQIQDTLSDMLIKYNESETRRSLSVNKQFSDVQNEEKDIMNRLKAINREISNINKSLETLSDEIEKQHVYMDFYQEQLKKEKGKE